MFLANVLADMSPILVVSSVGGNPFAAVCTQTGRSGNSDDVQRACLGIGGLGCCLGRHKVTVGRN